MSSRHVVIVGAGGNIGSHLVPHVARMPGVGRITLVDPDVYERRNLSSQDIWVTDLGARKVEAQARRIRRLAGDGIEVVELDARVEDVAVGRLQADVILACLDSRVARQHVNQTAWRLGVPWIDSGVAPDAWLARVNVYVPGLDTGCLECAWDDRDYAAIEQVYPCDGHAAGPPTDGPSSLGALAAALQAIECRKLLEGDIARLAAGRQILIDAASHNHYVTAFPRRTCCRMWPHTPLEILQLDSGPDRITLGALFERAQADGLLREGLALEIDGRRLTAVATCPSPACGRPLNVWRFGRHGAARVHRCPRCGGPVTVRGFDVAERLLADIVPGRLLGRRLRRLGVRDGELCTLGAANGRRHYVVGGDQL